MEQASSSQLQPSTSNGCSEEDLMKLLRGESDSQRLAGLLLVTKLFDKKDFEHTIPKVYEALGTTFLHRLLLTGIGKGDSASHSPDREAYLRLAVTVLAAFVRVPQIAASQDMLLKVPLVIDLLSTQSDITLIEECYEFLYLVSMAREDGIRTFYESGGIKTLALHMPNFPNGSHVMELSIRLVQLIVGKLPAKTIYVEHSSELSQMVVVITKQFALLHNALKFEALHLLFTILSSNYSGPIRMMLQSVGGDWPTSMRVGIMDVLQNRIAPADKIQALALAEYAISIIGEEWMIGPTSLPGARNSFPPDRCLFLVLESSRVEVAVILNELAYLKYEASENSPNAEKFHARLSDVAIAFALVERIIKLISKFGDNEADPISGSSISEDTLTKIIWGLNETIGVVLDYLQDAKEHGQRKGDDLLASVRVVGSYLAEAPSACKEKIDGLLGYMLSVEGEDEPSPFNSISFLLPLLCQITMSDDGFRVFASSGAFETVGGYLMSLIDSGGSKVENQSTIFLACDTILNFLLKIKQAHSSLVEDNPCCIKLLQAMLQWTDGTTDQSIVMIAASICSLILDRTSEEALLRHPEFKSENLIGLSQLMKRSLTDGCDQEVMSNDVSSEADLHQIIVSGYSSWADRFPRIKGYLER